MITKIVECGNIREFQLSSCLCQRERFETAILWDDEYPQSKYCIHPRYTLTCCFDGIIQEKETDLGDVHTVPGRFLLR